MAGKNSTKKKSVKKKPTVKKKVDRATSLITGIKKKK